MRSFKIQPFKGQLEKHIVVRYAENGLLCAIEWHNLATVDDITFSRQFTAMKLSDFLTVTRVANKNKAVFAEIPTDLSFEAFWNQYGHKQGDKSRAQKLWKLLSDEDKVAALGAIKRYKNYLLAHPAQECLYPQTYLNQRRWENDF